MTDRSRAAIPVAIVSGVAIAAAGVVAVVQRMRESRRDRSPAPEGTARIEGRLPLALWPSNGREPMVARGPRGWAEMLAALHHPGTPIDDAQRARAIVIAEYSRKEQDSRRQVALEAHVMLGAYEPTLVAAAWRWPLRAMAIDDLVAFGFEGSTVETLRALAHVDAQPTLIDEWRRQLGVDALRPEITPALVDATEATRLGMLWAVLLHLAT
ncbi:MAG: hypothetical protein ACTHKX_07015, partial [Pseudolysinimonas sp.]